MNTAEHLCRLRTGCSIDDWQAQVAVYKYIIEGVVASCGCKTSKADQNM